MNKVVISGSGLYTPPYSVSNDELVNCYNSYVDQFNQQNAAEIEAGNTLALAYSSSEFIEKPLDASLKSSAGVFKRPFVLLVNSNNIFFFLKELL